MKNAENLELLEYSLKNPEPIIDNFYLKRGNLIISESPKTPTNLMTQNLDLIESISAYHFAKKSKSPSTARKAIERIAEILIDKNINYSEFVSFWPVVDISYSLFRNMDKKDQLQILEDLVEKYIDLRHGLYSTYGYTPTTLQVGKDAKAHKESGNLGIYKVSKILDSFGYKNANRDNINDFVSSGEKKYVEADKKGKKLFIQLLKAFKLKFAWSSNKERKMPDFLFRNGSDIFILEHKHMKEGGGGQDKQINEVISFVGFSEQSSKIHYVSFLDGLYFNLFSKKSYASKGKIFNQLKNIKTNLSKNKGNYFVNTAGFARLLESI